MPSEVIKFARPFQIWNYTVSHRQLLLRSTKSQERQTRVDVLFKGVAALGLPSAFRELEVRPATSVDIDEIGQPHCSRLSDGAVTLYVVRGGEFLGYVAAVGVFVHEDDAEYNEASFFSE